ncbi:MAG TPA: lysylphosphatidylglycerol synthase transmembrane domain-containing protein [Salinivirgaceae bacterium]|nr:lysylphosphatidylglycerol synthase transmembrane domain-containing protein [Salinivirgaceae bacterium]HQA76280.1 lysylphosphatidylglycerol synthase transmembrane domain-containing protein [Salinivirgaceae bacterium]
MKKKIVNAFKFLLFIGIGIFLFWKLYKDQSIDDLIEASKNLNYYWLILAAIVSVGSHLVRAIRWELALTSIEMKARRSNLFHAVMVGYLVNLAIPRLGEVTRAAVLKKYEKISFTGGFGTIIAERIVDLIIIIGITVVVIFYNDNFFSKLLEDNPALSENIQNLLSVRNLIIFIALCVISVIGYLILLKYSKKAQNIIKKIFDKITTLKEGLLSIFKLKHPALFIFYSLLIWILYFIVMCLTFKAFSFTGDVLFTVNQMLVVFLIGSYGMLAPVQGGIGAYHFMVVAALTVYGIGSTDARFFALIAHAVSMVVVIVVGFISLVLLPISNRKKSISN